MSGLSNDFAVTKVPKRTQPGPETDPNSFFWIVESRSYHLFRSAREFDNARKKKMGELLGESHVQGLGLSSLDLHSDASSEAGEVAEEPPQKKQKVAETQQQKKAPTGIVRIVEQEVEPAAGTIRVRRPLPTPSEPSVDFHTRYAVTTASGVCMELLLKGTAALLKLSPLQRALAASAFASIKQKETAPPQPKTAGTGYSWVASAFGNVHKEPSATAAAARPPPPQPQSVFSFGGPAAAASPASSSAPAPSSSAPPQQPKNQAPPSSFFSSLEWEKKEAKRIAAEVSREWSREAQEACLHYLLYLVESRALLEEQLSALPPSVLFHGLVEKPFLGRGGFSGRLQRERERLNLADRDDFLPLPKALSREMKIAPVAPEGAAAFQRASSGAGEETK